MSKEKREVRNKIVMVRMNETEFKSLQQWQQKSTCRNTSEYLRKVGLQQPVIIKTRNQSLDDLVQQFIRLKNELNAVGNNLNQAVHKLHILDRIPEFRVWLTYYENTRQSVEQKITEIKSYMKLSYQQWSPK